MVQAIKQVVKMILAWSYSRYSDYAKCPALAKYKHVEKRKEPDNEYTLKGGNAHKDAEAMVQGRAKKLPPVLAKFKSEFVALQKEGALTEQEWAFDRQWNKVGWFDSAAWLRVKMDTHYLEVKKVGKVNRTTVRVIDYKTGKVRPDDHEMQRSLYGIGAMLVYPDAYNVVAEHWYLDTGEIAKSEYLATDLAKMQREWLARTKAMLSDTRFAPRPGRYCMFCHFRKGNGGPCQY